jgi:hypothetical protein
MSDVDEPVQPPFTAPGGSRRRPSDITLSEQERAQFIDSIDRQLADLEQDADGGST